MSAAHDRIDAEAFEDTAEAIAAGHGHHRKMLRARRTAHTLALQPVMLRRHVIDLEAAEPSDTTRVADHDGRLVGVHMDLDRGVVADDQR